jgi:hypothetical protein
MNAQAARSCRLPTGRRVLSEAHYELFRDWQRSQTQSSVKARMSPRPQMDVRSCWSAGTISREAPLRSSASRSSQRALSTARHLPSRFLLTVDLHGCRQIGILTPLRPCLPSRQSSCWKHPNLAGSHGNFCGVTHGCASVPAGFNLCERMPRTLSAAKDEALWDSTLRSIGQAGDSGDTTGGDHTNHNTKKRQTLEAMPQVADFMVELSGIEPLTSSLRTRRSPS